MWNHTWECVVCVLFVGYKPLVSKPKGRGEGGGKRGKWCGEESIRSRDKFQVRGKTN